MDSPRERDQTIDRLLRQTFETPPGGGVTDACLDAETLAAWTSGSLSGAALDAVQLHVADCPRCQEVAGTLSRLGAAVPHAEPAAAPRRWLAWLVPLAAAAAAVAIWFAIPGNLGKPPTTAELARGERAQQPATAEPSGPRDRNVVDGAAEHRSDAKTPAEIAPPAAGEPQPPRDAPAAAPPAAAAAPRDERESPGRNDTAPLPAQSALGAAAAPEPRETESETARRSVEAARAPATAAAPAPGFAVRVPVAPDVIISSPDPAVRWRILGATVQHSANGGATWEPVATGIPSELRAGAAPAPAVCWLVGRNGVVLLTMDGQTWRRVPFPEAIDLSAVRAVDAGGRVATVVASDGRTFVTTDAGVTWTSR